MMMRETFRTMAAGLVLILATSFFVTMTVRSQSGQDRALEQVYYDGLESDYIGQVAAALEQNGLSDSGINMTRVSGADGSRVYTVVIHNSYFCLMDAGRQAKIREEVKAVPFADGACSFCHKFIAGKSSGKGL